MKVFLWISSICLMSGLSGAAFVPQHRQSRFSKTMSLNLKDENLTPEEREVALEKATKAMTAFSNT